jgi:hypothetical protein
MIEKDEKIRIFGKKSKSLDRSVKKEHKVMFWAHIARK